MHGASAKVVRMVNFDVAEGYLAMINYFKQANRKHEFYPRRSDFFHKF